MEQRSGGDESQAALDLAHHKTLARPKIDDRFDQLRIVLEPLMKKQGGGKKGADPRIGLIAPLVETSVFVTVVQSQRHFLNGVAGLGSDNGRFDCRTGKLGRVRKR